MSDDILLARELERLNARIASLESRERKLREALEDAKAIIDDARSNYIAGSPPDEAWSARKDGFLHDVAALADAQGDGKELSDFEKAIAINIADREGHEKALKDIIT